MRTGILIGGAAVAIAGLIAAAPPVIGMVTEQEFDDTRERAIAESPFIRDWTFQRYDKGYLGARATSKVVLGAPGEDESVSVKLEHRMHYLPAADGNLVRIRTEPVIPEGAARRALTQLYGDERAPLQVTLDVDFSGAQTFRAHSPATDGARRIDAGRIDWQGLDATVTLDRGAGSIDYSFALPGLRVDPATGEITSARIESIQAEGQYQTTGFADVWTGNASGGIGQIVVEHASDGRIGVEGVTISDESRLDNDLVGFTAEVSAERLHGPEYTLSALDVRLSGERLAPSLLQALQRAGERAQAQGEGADGDAFMKEMNQLAWGDIAAREPLLRLDRFEADTPEGRLALGAEAGLHAPDDSGGDLDLRSLMPLAHGEVTARAPRAMVIDAVSRTIALRSDTTPEAARASAVQTLQNLASQGLLNIADGEVEASARYDRGAITINGRSLFGG